ncbi:hypothetical protein RND81_06G083500 [Saponaria officinalis]|uniref:G domain-containing protein n=1 Tax=Saponaria officinalis TaxID=3572 RepID=A0AAW1K7G8_SAPOF
MERLAKQVGTVVRNRVGHITTPLMAAASRAIRDRLPLVDFVIDLPFSSECDILLDSSSSSRRIIVFNKLDLAVSSLAKECIQHFERQNFAAFGVNSHNITSVQQLLNFLQCQVRSLTKTDPERNTITMMLIGIPNVGKSALANALHQIGRISAAEKGKLKRAVVSPFPGETKSISSLKVASHPNIYILDTPGVLPPQMSEIDVCAKLALTGAIGDSLAGEKLLAQLFLSILNMSKEHQKWQKLSTFEDAPLIKDEITGNSERNKSWRDDLSTDHTKDSVVLSVRRRLAEAISSFKGNIHEDDDMVRLIEEELFSLRKAFNLCKEPDEDIDHKVAVKLLNLFRTGRLGHYMLDSL